MLTVIADELPRVMACNGSRLMPAAVPPTVTDPTARNEGTAAHHMATAVFYGAKLEALVNTKAPNGFIMTAQMADHVGEYLAALDCGEMECDTSYGTDDWRVNGRCDHRKYDPASATLIIDDFKYGYSLVEAEGNWTLLSHAIGTAMFMPAWPRTFVLRIHQPRPYHPAGKVREWRLSYDELITYYHRINETLSNPSDELRTGAWCRRCPALAHCPAARSANMNAIDAAEKAFCDNMPDDVLSHELDTLRTAQAILSARLDAVEELAIHRLKNGAVMPNYAIEHQYANTRWKGGLDAQLLSLATGKDLTKPGLVTPAEAKRRGVPETVVGLLTERPVTGTKLVRITADDRAKRLLKGK